MNREELIEKQREEIIKLSAQIVELNLDAVAWKETAATFEDFYRKTESELAAIKAQEPVAYIPVDRATGEEWPPVMLKGSGKICDYRPLYAAPAATRHEWVGCIKREELSALWAPQPFATDDQGEPLGWIEQDKTNTAVYTEAAPVNIRQGMVGKEDQQTQRIGELEWLLRDVIETLESTDAPLENSVEYVVSRLVPETTRNEK